MFFDVLLLLFRITCAIHAFQRILHTRPQINVQRDVLQIVLRQISNHCAPVILVGLTASAALSAAAARTLLRVLLLPICPFPLVVLLSQRVHGLLVGEVAVVLPRGQRVEILIIIVSIEILPLAIGITQVVVIVAHGIAVAVVTRSVQPLRQLELVVQIRTLVPPALVSPRFQFRQHIGQGRHISPHLLLAHGLRVAVPIAAGECRRARHGVLHGQLPARRIAILIHLIERIRLRAIRELPAPHNLIV